MTSKPIKVKVKTQPAVIIEAEVARKIRQHARTSMKAEVCGVLLGSAEPDRTVIEACVAGINAAQGGAHVTFTQDTWEHIYKIKDQQFPDSKIVGWYHSHPGFGVFLSEHDLFIQENFFSSPHQVAWVYDPHTDEEGCFGWVGGATEKLSSIRFGYSQSVEISGSATSDYEEDGDAETGLQVQVKVRSDGPDREPAWLKWASRILAYIAVLGVGFVIGHEYMAYKVTPTLRAYEELLHRWEPVLRACEDRFQSVSPFQPSASGLGGSEGQNPRVGNPPPAAPQKAPEQKGSNGRH
ncbi:MAG TPA: Mov34/MPN/PAD-1 family protein [Candidatus Angelobacter sp.]